MTKIFIVHNLDQCQWVFKALENTDRQNIFGLTPPFGAASMGVGYFVSLVKECQKTFSTLPPMILDCGDKSGHVLSALRCDLKHVLFTGSQSAHKKLQEIASQNRATLYDDSILEGHALDLSHFSVCDRDQKFEEWLSC
ncbi:MAG: hypothetical protein HOI80_04325 [Alphaproteobacteria bacterium]|jgi:hypothetical protein|nr:hypothetical protein [Alphaproteobacteria bacterium]MBT5389179.1 hypothetical protein [Alphaproteobacteria bacterium]MBT5540464.1 hypothetical protein [Alphaproteobacteria bacterium]MBT5654709.1 hypothetical protein [Alphaproteobacteria bacterium]